jgi:hypothetical protein
MMPLPDMIVGLGTPWHVAMIVLGVSLWLLAVRRVVRDLRREAARRAPLPRDAVARDPGAAG